MRGSVLIESLLAVPLVCLALAYVLWWLVRGTESLTGTYAVFMAARAASVATTAEEAEFRAHGQAAAIFPVVEPRRVQPPWRLRHVEQPRGTPQPRGDNPLL